MSSDTIPVDEQIDPVRITRGLRDQIEALSSTADMIDVLLEIADENARTLKKCSEERPIAWAGEWRVVLSVLELARRQCEIVKDVSDRFHDQESAALKAA